MDAIQYYSVKVKSVKTKKPITAFMSGETVSAIQVRGRKKVHFHFFFEQKIFKKSLKLFLFSPDPDKSCILFEDCCEDHFDTCPHLYPDWEVTTIGPDISVKPTVKPSITQTPYKKPIQSLCSKRNKLNQSYCNIKNQSLIINHKIEAKYRSYSLSETSTSNEND